MGFFDRFKKKENSTAIEERQENFPEMLSAKLLFFERPVIDAKLIDPASLIKSWDSAASPVR